MVAFGGVVVNYVEDDFDAGGMQRLHHRLELADGSARGVAWLGGKKTNGVIAPVVAETLFDKDAVINEGMYRHQLDGGNTQAFQIIDHRGCRQSSISSALGRGNFRMQLGETPDVHLINHTLVPGNTRRLICSPTEGGINHYTFEHAGSAVPAIERQIFFGVTNPVAEVRIAPLQIILDLLGVGIQQELMVVKTLSVRRIVRTVDTVTV